MRLASPSAMDVARPSRSLRLRKALTLGGALAIVSLAAIAWIALTRSSGPGVSVDRSSVVTDVARRGRLDRAISATGTIASQYVRVIAAAQPGILEAVYVKPGATVTEGTPVARLSNPQLDADAVSASSAVDVAQAELRSARAQARASALAEQSALTTAQAQAAEDTTKLQSLDKLRRDGYIAEQSYQIANIEATRSTSQLGVAHAALTVDAAQQDAKVAAAEATLRQAQAQLAAKRSEVDALTIRSRTAGVVQSVAVDPGARVDAGAELARVADQNDLKAVVSVPEGEVHSVAIGMPVRIDTGNGSLDGRVERIAPAAQNGTVAVDVALPRRTRSSLRPDTTIEATIELQTLADVLSIARPAGAADDAAVSLYRLDRNGSNARILRVQLGRGSTDRIQVVSGLQAGDTVIVSDTSSYGGAPILHLH